jgi:hypothetical protein
MKKIDKLIVAYSVKTQSARRESARVAELIRIADLLNQIAGPIPTTPAQKLARDMLDFLDSE